MRKGWLHRTSHCLRSPTSQDRFSHDGNRAVHTGTQRRPRLNSQKFRPRGTRLSRARKLSGSQLPSPTPRTGRAAVLSYSWTDSSVCRPTLLGLLRTATGWYPENPCPIIHFRAAVGAWRTTDASSRGGTIGSSGSSF